MLQTTYYRDSVQRNIVFLQVAVPQSNNFKDLSHSLVIFCEFGNNLISLPNPDIMTSKVNCVKTSFINLFCI